MNFKKSKFVNEIGEITQNMYRQGWNERNGGNISMLITEQEIKPYLRKLKPIRNFELTAHFPELEGKYFLITGTGKYFKNVYKSPEECLGLIKITNNGATAELLWGFNDGGRYTSEVTMHLASHKTRLAIDPNHRIVMHAHPVNTICMTHIVKWDNLTFTRALWGTCTECVVIFPEGVAVLPWMVSSSDSIGLVSAEMFKDYRILVWGIHGIIATGTSIDEAFGLIETVEKAAEIFMKTDLHTIKNKLSDKDLLGVVDAFGLTVKEGWLK